MPLFTVVIPVWNKQPHIRRAVESVLAQTCQDFELIAVNDHSTDGGEAEFCHFSDPRINLLNTPGSSPCGPGSARNVGILAAKGTWVSFLDADDTWEPRYLEEMRVLIAQFPQAGILACAHWLWDQRGRHLSLFSRHALRQGHQQLDFRRFLEQYVRGNQPVWTSVTTVQKRTFQTAGLFPDGVVNCEDLDLWFRILAETPLAWSPYVGATYFDNTVNKLTKFNNHNQYNLVPTLKNLMDRPGNKALVPLLKKANNLFFLARNLPRVKNGEQVRWVDFAGFSIATYPIISMQLLLLIVLPNCWALVLLSMRRKARLWWRNLVTPASEQGLV